MWRSFRSDNARRYPPLLVLSLVATPLVAQVSSRPVLPYGPSLSGDVRLRAPSIAKPRIFGTVDRATPDTLVLRSVTPAGDDTVLAIPVSAITRLQVSTGTHRNAGKGLLIGLLSGGLGGAALGALSCGGQSDWGPGACAAVLGILGAGGGAVVGLIIGAVSRTDTWTDVPLGAGPRVTLDWRSEGRSLHLGARIAF